MTSGILQDSLSLERTKVMEKKSITSNYDLKIFVASEENSSLLARRALRELGYDVLDEQDKAQYLVFNDLDKKFDINLHREELNNALKNGQKIIFLSKKQLPFFCFKDPESYELKICKSYLTHLRFNLLKEKDNLLMFEAEIENSEAELDNQLCPKLLSKALLASSTWKRHDKFDSPTPLMKKDAEYIYWNGLWY